MSCCGGSGPDRSGEQASGSTRVGAWSTGGIADGVLVRYIGARSGAMTWTAPSGQQYKIGGAQPLHRVRHEDADWFAENSDFEIVEEI
jgi:hypothetical protein